MNEAENFHPPEYADGRADQLREDLDLLAWAYRKLLPYSFAKQEDALQMDRLKMLIEYGVDPF